MAVKVKEWKGAWWVFINHEGKRRAKRVGTKQAAQKLQQEIEFRLKKGELYVDKPEPTPEPTLAEYVKTWEETRTAEVKHSTMDSYLW